MFSISVANLLVIVTMLVVFVLALLPFPHSLPDRTEQAAGRRGRP